LRFDSITIEPLEDVNLWVQVLTREISDRITVIRRPSGGGPAIQQDCHIERVTHEWDAETGAWQTTWMLSPASQSSFWILGDPVFGLLGSTTRLAY
jgi:hypothetical protein